MISTSLNVTKIDKDALYVGKNGKYLNLTLIENRDGIDRFGNAGFVVQDLGKDRRAAGEKGPILGNYKRIAKKPAGQQQSTLPGSDDDENAPF